jgi:hypothetical protein
LTIALGQAEVLRARLLFANAPGGGAIAMLTLPQDGRGTSGTGGEGPTGAR